MLSCEICEIFWSTFFYRTPPVAASDNSEEVITTDCHLLCCFYQPVNRNQAFSIFKQVHELRHEQCNRSVRHKWHKDRSLIIQNLVLILKRLVVGGSNRSEDVKVFSVNINYFHRLFGFSEVLKFPCYKETDEISI